jgi:hypothetical protein
MSSGPPFSGSGIVANRQTVVFGIRQIHACIGLCASRHIANRHESTIRSSPQFIGKLVCLDYPTTRGQMNAITVTR